jgi:hypothetical protein
MPQAIHPKAHSFDTAAAVTISTVIWTLLVETQ